MPHTGHPHPAALHRFLRGETSRAETRTIVRHLLRGCPRCAAVTGRVWRLADETLRDLPHEKTGRRVQGELLW